MSPVHRGRPHARHTALLGVLGLTLGACSAESIPGSASAEEDPTPPLDIITDPVPVQAPAEAADLDAIHLPVSLSGLLSVDPQWDTPPQVHDDVFLAPGRQDDRLVFSAVSADGTLLWTAERPLSRSGFALSSAGDRPLAVLTDLAGPTETGNADAPSGATTATAYDLHTGEDVWGPVEVPGPHQGPGLVFAAQDDEPLGSTGQRVALDAETGEPRPGSAHVVGEFYGTTVLAEDAELIASAGGDSGDLWRAPSSSSRTTAEDEALVSPATNRLPPGSALIGSPDDGYGLWDLVDGAPLTGGLDDAMLDAMSETWVGVREDELAGFDSAGGELWSVDLDVEPTLLGVGGVMAYLHADGADLEIYNAVTGNTARVYDPVEEGATAVPLAFTETGAVAVDTGAEILLVTDVPGSAEDYPSESDPLDERP